MKVIAAALLVFLGGSAPARVAVGQFSYGLAPGGGSLWVGGLGGGNVLRVDPETGRTVKEVRAGPRIFNLAAGGGSVWAVSNAGYQVVRIDPGTGKVTQTVRVGAAPYDVAWGFGSVWVANSGDGTVWRITNGRVVRKLQIGVEPNGLTAYAGSLWVSDHTLGKVVRIDPATNRVTGTVKLAGADWIVGHGNFLYVSQETNRIARVDARTLKVTGSVATARNPLGAAIVGARLWVPCIDGNEIDVIDLAGLKVVARKKEAGGPIVVLPAFGHVWVSHTTANYLTRL
jgi:DNA-binding beta-propeller fold protein YncE